MGLYTKNIIVRAGYKLVTKLLEMTELIVPGQPGKRSSKFPFSEIRVTYYFGIVFTDKIIKIRCYFNHRIPGARKTQLT